MYVNNYITRIMKFCFIAVMLVYMTATVHAQDKTKYPDIPRIDVHCHIGENDTTIANYLELRDRIKAAHNIDFAIWINLGAHDNPTPDLNRINKLSKNRMLTAINDYSSHDGLQIAPDKLPGLLASGYVGYKIWAGPWYRKLKENEKGYRYIDDPAHDPTFSKME